MEKIYGMHKLVGHQLFWSGTPTFSSGTPTFCQMGVLNSCFQNPSESSAIAVSHEKPGSVKPLLYIINLNLAQLNGKIMSVEHVRHNILIAVDTISNTA